MHTALCDQLGIEFPIFEHCGNDSLAECRHGLGCEARLREPLRANAHTAEIAAYQATRFHRMARRPGSFRRTWEAAKVVVMARGASSAK